MNSGERRIHLRTSVSFEASLVFEGGNAGCTVVDISVGGAKLRTDSQLARESPLILEIKAYGAFPGHVRRQSAGELGMAFDEPPEVIAETLIAMATYKAQ